MEYTTITKSDSKYDASTSADLPIPDGFERLEVEHRLFLNRVTLQTKVGIEQCFDKLKEWFYMDEHQYARELIDRLNSEVTDPELKELVRIKFEEVEEAKQFVIDFQLYDDTIMRLQKIKNNEPDDWIKHTDTPKVKLYYKQEPGQQAYTFYTERQVTCEDPINALCIVVECQEFKNWVPLQYRSDVMHETSDFRK